MPEKTDQAEQVALTDFLTKNTRIKPLTNVKDLKTLSKENSPQFYFVGANWCGYSQLGAPHFDVACDREKEPQCHLIDGGTQEGQKILDKLGFKVEGFPTLFVKDGDKTIKVTGMRNVKQMQEIISKSKSVLAQHKVGSRPSIFPI